jgi:hypothetical protein
MARSRRAALALAAAASLSVTAALSSFPSAGVPCASVLPSAPAYACDRSYVPTDYYGMMKAGTINNAALGIDSNGAWAGARLAASAMRFAHAKLAEGSRAACPHAGGCDFIEDAFEGAASTRRRAVAQRARAQREWR